MVNNTEIINSMVLIDCHTVAEHVAFADAFFDAPWLPIFLAIVYLFSLWIGLFATVLGDAGAGLSGGQNQRIGLARARCGLKITASA